MTHPIAADRPSSLMHAPGNDYAFLPGGQPFSCGIVALPGFEIVRARFARPLPVTEGFEAIAAHLRERHRPLTALCAAELRSPAPFSVGGFSDFNVGYVSTLKRWGLYRNDINPVTRSNVCPVYEPPPQPSFHAFCYTVPTGAVHTGLLTTSDHAADAPGPRNYVLAGAAEWPDGTRYPDGIIAYGDASAQDLSRKVGFVLDLLEQRTLALSANWRAATAVQVYTAHEIGALIEPHFVPRGLVQLGIDWHVCRPPVEGLEFEVDVRCVRRELVID